MWSRRGAVLDGIHARSHPSETKFAVPNARPRCATPDTPLSQVAELMQTQDIGAIPILDGDRLVGMITDRDIVVRAVAKDKDPRGMPSREISSGELVTVGPIKIFPTRFT
jgi:CBS domain-containing protein